MESNLITKTNELFGDVRFITIDDKQYAVGKDIAMILGYSNPRDAISRHCKGVVKHDSFKEGGNCIALITEGDIYRLIIKSKLPQAEKFESWVMDEVLPELRKSGAVILENATKETVNFKLKYGVYKIRKTFINSENLREDYNEFKDLSAIEWKAKRLDNSDRVKLSKLIQKGIQDKINSDFMTMRPSEMLACQELMTDIQSDITKLENKKNGGKLASATKTIKEYKKQIPNNDEYVNINYHPFSSNSMYEPYIKNSGELGQCKTKAYKIWIEKFPKTIIRENFGDVDLSKPTKMWLKFECLDRYDRDNLIKSIQDQIVRDLEAEDDNNISIGSVDIIKRVDTYKEGKIYILLKNI